MSTLPASLLASMASQTTGYGAIIEGVLNVRTVTEHPNGAALNALHIMGFQVVPGCREPDCDCLVRLMAELAQLKGFTARIVAVNVQVSDG